MFCPTAPALVRSDSRLSSAANATAVGRQIPLENIDWKASKKTLVMYLSTTCHFCDESSPFYKRLLEKYTNSKDVRFIAVLPQSINVAGEHLNKLGVHVSEIQSADFESIGVTATPTLLLVDESGKVSDTWQGKLTISRENDVFEKVSS